LLRPYLQPDPVLVVISGPSGVGKDAVIDCIRRSGATFHFVVTATNRCPREGEVHGVDYYFHTTAEFKRLIAQGEFLEHADVYGQFKGVPRSGARQALAAGLDVILRVDIQGAATIKRLAPAAVTIFLAPPSLESLVGRLCKRGSDTEEQVQQRMQMALTEMQRAAEFDYVVVNHDSDLESAAQAVLAIIQAEKCRAVRPRIEL
jgi:guanylate kinase